MRSINGEPQTIVFAIKRACPVTTRELPATIARLQPELLAMKLFVISMFLILSSHTFCQPVGVEGETDSSMSTSSAIEASTRSDAGISETLPEDALTTVPTVAESSSSISMDETTADSTGAPNAEKPDFTTEREAESSTWTTRKTGDTGAPEEGKPRPSYEWFPLMMLAVGLTAVLITLTLVLRRFMSGRGQQRSEDVPMSFSNPIYDVALASLRRGSEGIAEAEDALTYEPWRRAQ